MWFVVSFFCFVPFSFQFKSLCDFIKSTKPILCQSFHIFSWLMKMHDDVHFPLFSLIFTFPDQINAWYYSCKTFANIVCNEESNPIIVYMYKCVKRDCSLALDKADRTETNEWAMGLQYSRIVTYNIDRIRLK